MNKLISIILIFVIFILGREEINAQNAIQEEVLDSISVSMDGTKLILWGLSKENFGIEVDKDTIFIRKKLYEGIDYLQIQFIPDKPDNILEGAIIYGVYQMLLDDMGSTFLNFSYKDSIQIIKINDRYRLLPAIKTFEQQDSICNKKYFAQIKQKSYALQKKFYREEVLDRSKRYDCCPEYIEQAKKFLSKKKSNFKTIEDLALGTSYKKITLKLEVNKYLVFYEDISR